MRLTVASQKAIQYACIKFHYSKCVPVVGIGFNVYNDNDEWCGVIIYGYGANNHIAMPFNKWQGQVMELVRVALNGKQGHGRTSKALSLSLKLLTNYFPAVDIVVSYADLDQNHNGTLYQCTNWIYTGLTNANQRGAFIIKGKKMHPKSVHSRKWKQSLLWLRENIDPNAQEYITKGKHKYVYPIDKSMRKRLELLSVPYPQKEG